MPIAELGDSINSVDADTLAGYIRKAWDKKVDTKNREDVDDGITLSQWGKVIIDRKLKSNKPGTASWYTGAIRSITKLNWGRDLRLNEITVTLLTNFQIEHKAKSTSKNGNSSYLRAVRAIYMEEAKRATPSRSGLPKVLVTYWSSTLRGNNPKTICFPPIMTAVPNIFKSTNHKEGE